MPAPLLAIAVFFLGVVFFWTVVTPLALGTIEWVLNVGNVRRR